MEFSNAVNSKHQSLSRNPATGLRKFSRKSTAGNSEYIRMQNFVKQPKLALVGQFEGTGFS
jgi:hypothetical protein